MSASFRDRKLLASWVLGLGFLCGMLQDVESSGNIPSLASRSPGNHGDGGGDPSLFKCELDPKLTEEDLPFFVKDIERVWGSACGRNRGVFVLDPPDGHTYGCGNLPKEWGVEQVGDITDLTKTGADVALSAYGKLIDKIYKTTIGKTAAACDFDALTILTCGREEPWRDAPWADKLGAPIRAVNIGGLFVLERWILPSFTRWGDDTGIVDQHSFSEKCEALDICDDLKMHWKDWYSAEDFLAMKEAGLNSIRLPVGWWYFAEKGAIDSSPYIVPDEDLYEEHHPITDVIRWAKEAGLYVIIDLHGAPGSQNGLDNSGLTSPDPNELVWGENWIYSPEKLGNTIKILAVIAEYINHIEDSLGINNVMALELLNEPWAHLDLGLVRDFYATSIETVRLVRPLMPVIIHDSFRGPMWPTLLKNFPYKNVFMDTHIYHGFNKADLASDTPQTDRLKMYVHERMACSYTSMLRYETCAALPVMVGEWSLAIDNCMPHLDMKFANFGQCDHYSDRGHSWWNTHVRSFAMRQISMYEREMGWSFWAWKLDDYAEENELSAPYWSFRLAVQEGYIDTSYPGDTCLHPPAEDWMNEGVSHMTTVPAPVQQPESGEVSEPNQAQVSGEDSTGIDFKQTSKGGLRTGAKVSSGTLAVIVVVVALCGAVFGAGLLGVVNRHRQSHRSVQGFATLFKSGYSSLSEVGRGNGTVPDGTAA